ncbi:hypothetical protein PGT21_021551 [Puccinia graminis f. sp. tritici]|uniref:Uncharacterized protein n=1 Tax=Puccinia graminis f. sp. tritici TaxID=56615 RepID=A0A5B0RKY0_PUCGR|nr:hypothetical protein PGT21_021551 [Puccinia graminis f. sp. tritici]KAA1125768.1 hypothetical protein PGTUg99_017036 [Puccinia graminis f. sp. tritici]
MLRLSAIVYVCSALSHVLSTPLVPAHLPSAPGPYLRNVHAAPAAEGALPRRMPEFVPDFEPEHVQEYTILKDGTIRQRHRKLLGEESTIPVPPPSVAMYNDYDTRKMTPDEEQWVKHFAKTHNQGRPYRLTGENQFTEIPKENCDHDYFCGRMRFYDGEDKLLHDTGCCHCNASCLSVREANAAEVGIGIGVFFGAIAAVVTGVLGCAGMCAICEKTHCCTCCCR